MTAEPAYTFAVSTAHCERCSRRPAYVVENRGDGRRTLLCKRHLEPWLEERRWAVVRMSAPIGSEDSRADSEAQTKDTYADAVRVIYTEKEN
jgi:hypothetical protein